MLFVLLEFIVGVVKLNLRLVQRGLPVVSAFFSRGKLRFVVLKFFLELFGFFCKSALFLGSISLSVFKSF